MTQTQNNLVNGRLVKAGLMLMAGVLFALPVTAREPEPEINGAPPGASEPAEPPHHPHWKRKSMSSFYAQGGVAFIDYDALNSRLTRSGYDSLDEPSVPVGFGFNHRFKRLTVGLDWYFLMHNTQDAPSDNLRMDMRNWYWQLSHGYDFVQTDSISVYAEGGLGVGHTSVWISDETGTSFNGVLQDPARSVYLTQTSFVLSATAGIDYRIVTGVNERRTRYVTVGLKGGYMYSPFAGDWHTHAAEIQNGPERGLNGPFAIITLGVSRKPNVKNGR